MDWFVDGPAHATLQLVYAKTTASLLQLDDRFRGEALDAMIALIETGQAADDTALARLVLEHARSVLATAQQADQFVSQQQQLTSLQARLDG